MTKFGNIRPCAACGAEVQFLPVMGWVHVSVFAALDCASES